MHTWNQECHAQYVGSGVEQQDLREVAVPVLEEDDSQPLGIVNVARQPNRIHVLPATHWRHTTQ